MLLPGSGRTREVHRHQHTPRAPVAPPDAPLVDHGVDGLLVNPQQPAELADAIESLARDGAKAAAMGRAARHKVQTKFQSQRSVEVLERLLPKH